MAPMSSGSITSSVLQWNRVTKLYRYLRHKREALDALVSCSTMSLKVAEPFICLELNNSNKLNSHHEV